MKIPPAELSRLIRIAIYMTALTAILYLTASNFDFTELRTLVMMFLVAAGTEYGHLVKLLGRKDQ